jgi:glycosyltransferase involved in cell wall biosynthesis
MTPRKILFVSDSTGVSRAEIALLNLMTSLNEKQFSPVLEALDILAHTQVTPEPVGLVLREAMAMGVPVIASDTGGTRELIIDGRTGFLVPPGNAQALAEATIRLLGEARTADEMGLAGRQRVEKMFTLDRQIQAVQRVWGEALSR